MKQITITLYEFNELPENIQRKVLDEHYDINIDHDWMDVYHDAEQIGIKITEFDLDMGRYCDGEKLIPSEEIANRILESHGEQCETYKTAAHYLEQRNELLKSTDDEYEIESIDDEFMKAILHDYSNTLQQEYDYLTSDETIKETILANEYTFEINGKMRNE